MLDPWFQKEKTRKLKSIRNSIYWHLVEKNVVNYVDGLLFTCQQELLLAKTSFYGYNPKKELNVGYGIIEPPINDSAMIKTFIDFCPNLKGKRYILFLSRIHFKKGVELLINAYNFLSKTILDIPHLVIAGSLDSVYAKEMISLSNNNPKIHFPGMLNGDVKWAAFYGCEAFILPSHQENFGIAVAEALACGKPVLISNKINIYREIEQGFAGIIGEDSLEGTITILNKWFDLSSVEKKIMSDSAFKVYLKYFNVKESARKLIKIIGK
jgi:glycosyltransferase involved in cell wall biosynthesis